MWTFNHKIQNLLPDTGLILNTQLVYVLNSLMFVNMENMLHLCSSVLKETSSTSSSVSPVSQTGVWCLFRDAVLIGLFYPHQLLPLSLLG